ncbi:MAG: LysR family transcriptional regulator [Synechococcales cyanobacterium RM1_1_8]|nr:LysR family transcriptional regulator [Synechococcales cyanobacterium RM1_1_8]
MRLEQIQAFLAVAETGSFQRAAQQCGVTQSTISRQIQSLEATVDLPLFHRGAKAKLTLGGEQLLPRARRICQEWSQALSSLETLRLGEQPELCIAAISSLCAHDLPPVLEQFGRDYPQTQLRVTALGSDRALKVLRDGLVDVAIVMNNPFLTHNAEVFVEYLYEETIQVLMSAQHPLASLKVIPWIELARYPQVVFKDGYGMQRLVQEQFNKQGLELRASVELNTLDAFRGMVRQGKSLALLPRMALAEALGDPTLAVRSLGHPELSRQVVLVTTRDRYDPPHQTLL